MSANTIVYQMTPAIFPGHIELIARITSDEFADGEYVEEISRQYIENCHYDPVVSRLIWDGDELVHHWGVWGYPMRVESVHLQVAGIGAVTTRPAYRKQGLMGRAAVDSLAAMRGAGYDLSILRGRHYVKYGYARAWNYVTYRLTAEEIPQTLPVQPYELIGPEQMDEINAMYNRDHAGFSGTCVRPTYSMLAADDMKAYGWFDRGGNLAGYVRAVPTDDKEPSHKGTLQCLEAAGDPMQGLAVLSDLFTQGDYEKLAFFTLPHMHPILQVLRRGPCTVEERYFEGTGWRVRVINLESTLRKLLPLLERRLNTSYYEDWDGLLHLDAGQQSASLNLQKGKINVAGASPSPHSVSGGWDVARFLIGSDEPGEIMRQAEMDCEGEAEGLLDVLFPNLWPVMSHWDEY